jgi:hypothetical protein
MSKTYYNQTIAITARPRSKRLREAGGYYTAVTVGKNANSNAGQTAFEDSGLFEKIVDPQTSETVGAKALHDLYIIQTPADEEATPPEPEVLKDITEILRHLSLQVVTPAQGDPYTVLVSDITIASEKNVVAGGVGDGQASGNTLDDLLDVEIDTSTLAAGHILVYDGLTNHWVNVLPSLNTLSDVTIGEPADGQSLVYNGTTGKWEPRTITGGGGGGTGSGTVTSVGLQVASGVPFTVSGSPITASGAFTLGLATGYAIPTTAQLAYWTLSSNTLITTRNVQIGANGTGNSRNLYVWGQMILHGATEFYADLTPVGNVNIGSSTNPWLAIYGTTLYEGGQSLENKYQAKLPSGSTDGQVLTWSNGAWVAGNAGGGGEVNVINSISVNGTAQTPDANKNVNITVPTMLSQLTADATHRLVTDTEKSTWNGKQAALPNGTTDGQVLTWKVTDNVGAWVAGNAGGGGEVNVIESISVNGTPQTVDSDKNVDLSVPTESTVSGWGFTKNAGTITGITMNGASKGTSGVVNLGTVLTAHQTLGLYAGTSGGTANGTVNADPYLLLTGGGANKGSVQIKGGTNITTSAASGVITINCTYTYTHPTAGANVTIAAADGKVLSAITVDGYGHVTSVSSKTLAAADIPDLSDTYLPLTGGTLSGNLTIGAGQSGKYKTLILHGTTLSTTPAMTIYGGTSSSYVTNIYRSTSELVFSSNISVTGNVKASGNVIAGSASDRRLKRDIKTIDINAASDILGRLNPVEYEWNDKALELGDLFGHSRGFIADEYLAVIPGAGRKMWGDYDAIDYNQVIPYIVAGWQQQDMRIRILEDEIKFLREENERLNRRVKNVI